jgi:hypothetical protein
VQHDPPGRPQVLPFPHGGASVIGGVIEDDDARGAVFQVTRRVVEREGVEGRDDFSGGDRAFHREEASALALAGEEAEHVQSPGRKAGQFAGFADRAPGVRDAGRGGETRPVKIVKRDESPLSKRPQGALIGLLALEVLLVAAVLDRLPAPAPGVPEFFFIARLTVSVQDVLPVKLSSLACACLGWRGSASMKSLRCWRSSAV